MTFSIVIPAFNEELLKKWGCKCGLKFIILTRHPLVTSPRSRIKLYTRQEIAGQLFSVLFSPRKTLLDKKKTADLVRRAAIIYLSRHNHRHQTAGFCTEYNQSQRFLLSFKPGLEKC